MGYFLFIGIVGLMIYVIYLHVQRDILKRECEYFYHAMASSLSFDSNEERRRAMEERDRAERMKKALKKALITGLPPHDVSGQRMWQEAREVLEDDE